MTTGSVLVTGASTGIGEACALLLAERGWEVYAGVRKEDDGARLVAAAAGRGAGGSAGGAHITPVLVDVTDEAGVAAAAEQIGSELGGAGLTAVVNNAGVAMGGPVEYLPLEDWRRQLEVNVVGQVSVTKAFLPLIRKSGRQGRLVFIGSVGGRVSSPLLGPYNASKHALEAIAESLRHELKPWGIRVVLVEPGAVKTPIWDKGRATADELERSLPPEASERYAAHIAGVRKGIEMQERNGVPASKVAEVVAGALESGRPRARYLVGRDAQIMGVMSRLFPDTARDFVVAKFAGP